VIGQTNDVRRMDLNQNQEESGDSHGGNFGRGRGEEAGKR
jgi:hypothetical protein